LVLRLGRDHRDAMIEIVFLILLLPLFLILLLTRYLIIFLGVV